jgi:DNA modification methylase
VSEPITWTNVTVKLSQLIPWDGNPKTSTGKNVKQLQTSRDELGQFQTVAIEPTDTPELYRVDDGHQRLNAWKIDKPHEPIAARLASRPLTEEERRKIAIYSRQIGAWDWDTLSAWDAGELTEWGFDTDLLGDWRRDVAALGDFIEANEEPEESQNAEPQTNRADELREEWGVELGQMWRLPSRVEGQEHRLICGDCTDGAVVSRVMGGEKAKMMLTSPPYNSKTGGIKSDYYKPQDKSFYIDKETDSKTKMEWVEFCDSVMNIFSSVSHDDKSVIVWNVMYNANMRGGYGEQVFGSGHNFTVKETICWNKGRGYNIATGGILSRNWELVFIMSEGNEYETSQTQYETRFNMWSIGTDGTQEKEVHNTAFPLEFATKAIDWFSLESYILYEPFSGSGTTIIAAENLSRQCRAVEISPAYCAVALQRYYDAFGIRAELVD